MTYLLFNAGITRNRNNYWGEEGSQTVGVSGGRGYFLLLTLSGLCLLLYPDKLLHTSPGDGRLTAGRTAISAVSGRRNIFWGDFFICKSAAMQGVFTSSSSLLMRCLFLSGLFSLLFSLIFSLRLLVSLSSAVVLLLAIAQPVRCCRHFAADPGAESLLPPNCKNVHFMVHIPRSSFVRVPLAPALISLTPSQTNKNKSNAHLLYLMATVSFHCLTFN